MSDEIKSALSDLQRANQEFQTTLTQRVDELAKKGVVHPDTQVKLDTIAAAMDTLKTKADDAAKREADLKNALDEQDARLQKLVAMGVDTKGDGLSAEQRTRKSMFLTYLRKGRDFLGVDEIKTMSVGSDPDGGFLVSPDMSGRVVKKVFDTSNVRAIASAQTISTDALEGLRSVGRASAGWVSETGSRTATSTPEIGKWRIPVHEIYANAFATQKSIEDAEWNIEDFLVEAQAREFSLMSETAFVTGDGVGKPRGFTTYTTATTVDDSRAWGTLQHVATGTGGGFGADPNAIGKLLDVVGSLKPHFQPGARWVMSRVTQTALRKLTDASSAGQHVFLQSMQAGIPNTVFGYPIAIADDMPAYSTTDALAIAFGDFRAGYQIVDRKGITVLRDPYTNKPFVGFYAVARVGGDVIDFEAIKFLKFGTS